MRIWDIKTKQLCRNHLLGEHRELHAIWVIITENKTGYRHHPEVRRWKGKLKALYNRHEELVTEMVSRGYVHRSMLNETLATGLSVQNEHVNTVQEQIMILKHKHCKCQI
jgi:hypothetical protein